MKQTPNYNLPILEAGDKYTKEYQNDTFRVIDTELKSLSDKVNLLDDSILISPNGTKFKIIVSDVGVLSIIQT